LKGIVVFDTSYGNTKAIADAILTLLKESGIEADAIYVKDAKKLSAKDYDFLVLGSPTRFGTMSFTVKGFLGKLKGGEWENKPFAAFDTENPENIERKEGSAAEKIAEQLKEKQMKQLLPVHKAVVLQTQGSMRCSLKEGEIERAKEYARVLAIELKR
jgi:menaquinone-dependent protoporphyrinogen IX oxidase